MVVDFLAVGEAVVVGVGVEGVGAVVVDFLAVGEAVVVGVGVGPVGAVVVDLFAVGEAVVVGVGVDRVGALLVLLVVGQAVVVGVVVDGDTLGQHDGAAAAGALGGGDGDVHGGVAVDGQSDEHGAGDGLTSGERDVDVGAEGVVLEALGSAEQLLGGADHDRARGQGRQDLGDGGDALGAVGQGDVDADDAIGVGLARVDGDRDRGVGDLVGDGGAGGGGVGARDGDVDVGELVQAQQGQGREGVTHVEVDAGHADPVAVGVGDDLVEDEGGDLEGLGQAQRVQRERHLDGDGQVGRDHVGQRDVLAEDPQPVDGRGRGGHAVAVQGDGGADGTDLDDRADAGDFQQHDIGDLAVGRGRTVGAGRGGDVDHRGTHQRRCGHGDEDVVGLDRLGAGREGHHARQALERQHLRAEQVDIGRQPAGVGDGGGWVLGAGWGGDGQQQDAHDGGGETGHDGFSLAGGARPERRGRDDAW